MRSPSCRKSWKLGRTRSPNLKTQPSQKTQTSQKNPPTRLFVLAGSCYLSLHSLSPCASCSNLRLRHAPQHCLQ